MVTEYFTLSTSCKDLLPLLNLIHDLSNAVCILMDDHSNMHIKIHKDTVGPLTLGKFEPCQTLLHLKCHAIKYHWFCEQIGPDNVEIVKVDATNQLGDIFTKGLGPTPFKNLCLKLMGW
ncbi:hypothetical protein ACHAW6_014106 [Cyclotella cf. meneghiniana]